MQLQNHNEECKTGELNPDKHEELKAVNTQVAEQFFAFLLKFVATFRNTSAIRAPVWIYLIQHQWNLKKEANINNTRPTKVKIEKRPELELLPGSQCNRLPVSAKSIARLRDLRGKLSRRLLKPWCAVQLSQRSTLKRKRVMTT